MQILRIENIEIAKDHILATDTTHTAIELVFDPDYTKTLVKDLGPLNAEAEKRYRETSSHLLLTQSV